MRYLRLARGRGRGANLVFTLAGSNAAITFAMRAMKHMADVMKDITYNKFSNVAQHYI